MYIKNSGQLREVIDTMSEMDIVHAHNLRIHFTENLFFKEFKKYGAEKMTSFYPDQWPAPVYKTGDPAFDETVRGLVMESAALLVPELNGETPEIEIRVLGGGDFAAACFEYGED